MAPSSGDSGSAPEEWGWKYGTHQRANVFFCGDPCDKGALSDRSRTGPEGKDLTVEILS